MLYKYYCVNLVFHKLIESTNFNLFTRVGEVKHFSVCLEIIFRYFLSLHVQCLHMFLKFIIKRVFHHDQTGHVVAAAVACGCTG